MKKILFLINGGKTQFANSLISYIEKEFPFYEKEYCVLDRRMQQKLPNKKNIHRVLSYKEFLFNRTLRKYFIETDKIIVSGLFTAQYVMFLFFNRYLKKTYFQFWGGDFYFLLNSCNIKNKFKKKVNGYCIKKSAGIILLLGREKDKFLKVFPFAKNKKFFFTPIPFSEKEEQIFKKYRTLITDVQNHSVKRILVGNSATETNKHHEIFDIISDCGFIDVEIICPLSYGNPLYRDEVIKEGKKLFGDLFIPIVEFMDFEEYTKLLMTCSVGIYNFERQQGLGNIFALVNMGKKVFLNQENPAFVNLSELGFNFEIVSQIKNLTEEQFFEWPDEKRKQNIQAVNKFKDNMLKQWTKILND